MRSLSILLLLAFLAGQPLLAQKEIRRNYYAAATGDSVPVKIWLPAGYDPRERYPVFYEFVYDHSGFLAAVLQHYFDAPKSIVVYVSFDPGNSHYSNPRLTESGQKKHRFLLQELIPAIEKEFSASAYRVAVGLSQGADYVNYILRNDPGVFAAYLIFSIESPKYEPDLSAYAKNSRDSMDYFIAMGDDEEERVAYAEKLSRFFQTQRQVRLQSRTYPRADHALAILHAFPDAVAFLFDDYIHLREKKAGETLLAYSTNLEREIKDKYGRLPEFNNYLFVVGQALKGSKDTADIAATLARIVERCNYLQLFNLAYALMAQGNLSKAEELLWRVTRLMPAEKKDQKLNPVMPYRVLALNVYDKQGRYEEAYATLVAAHEKVKVYDLGLLYYIGQYAVKRNFHLEKGVAALEEIAPQRERSMMSAYFPEDVVFALIAEGCWRLNQKNKARTFAKKALAVNPGNEEALNLLKRK